MCIPLSPYQSCGTVWGKDFLSQHLLSGIAIILSIGARPPLPVSQPEPTIITGIMMASNASSQMSCQNCSTSITPLWRRDEYGSVLCNACGLFLKLHGRPRPISLKTDVIKSRNRVKTMRPDGSGKKKVRTTGATGCPVAQWRWRIGNNRSITTSATLASHKVLIQTNRLQLPHITIKLLGGSPQTHTQTARPTPPSRAPARRQCTTILYNPL